MFFLLGTSFFSWWPFFFFGDEFSPFFQKYFEEKNSLLKIPCFGGGGEKIAQKREEELFIKKLSLSCAYNMKGCLRFSTFIFWMYHQIWLKYILMDDFSLEQNCHKIWCYTQKRALNFKKKNTTFSLIALSLEVGTKFKTCCWCFFVATIHVIFPTQKIEKIFN